MSSDKKTKREKKLIQPTWERRRKPSDYTIERLTRSETNIDQLAMATKSMGNGNNGKETIVRPKVKEQKINEVMMLGKINEMIQGLKKDLVTEIAGAKEQLQTIEKELTSAQSKIQQNELQVKQHDIKFEQIEKDLIDIRDRQRRQNVRVRFWPEMPNESPKKLRDNMLKWLRGISQDIEWKSEDIERIHRVSFRKQSKSTRDIIMRIANQYKKETLMRIARESPGQLKMEGTSIQLFNDLCPQTIEWRKSMKLCTSKLRDAGIRYSWGYPVCLKFQWKRKWHKINM